MGTGMHVWCRFWQKLYGVVGLSYAEIRWCVLDGAHRTSSSGFAQATTENSTLDRWPLNDHQSNQAQNRE